MKSLPAMLLLFFTLGISTGIIGTYLAISQQDSPYLKSSRLGDVVAALLVMGTYMSDSQKPDEWREIIGAKPKSADSWSEVFSDHSEFFRSYESKVSLVWRRSRNWSWDTKTQKEISQVELDNHAIWPEDKKNRQITRKPLTPEETTALIEIANNMQTQAIARRAELRWWVPIVFGLLGILIGALLKRETNKG